MMKKLFICIVFVLAASTFVNAQGCIEPSSEEGVQVIGYIQPQFGMNFFGDDAAGNDLNTNSFYFNRARLGVVGNIPYDVSYYVMMDFSSFKGGPYLLDAFITYSGLGPWAKISMGQFKNPFGLELGTPCQALYTVNRSMVVNELASPFRDIGVMVSGGTDTISFFGLENKNIFSYSLALLNGTGKNVMDTDRYKDFVGRLVFAPTNFLKIGTSYRTGQLLNPDPAINVADKRTRFGADLSFNYKNFILQGEYISGKDEGSKLVGGGCGEEPTPVAGTFNSSGYMVQALYMTPWQLQPVIKYEAYDPDTDVEFNSLSTLTFGFNYFINEWTRVQLNYMYNVEESSEVSMADYHEISNDALILQLQVIF
jgi:phosphate-selective porin